MATVALELVPPSLKGGLGLIEGEAIRVSGLLDRTGLRRDINTLVVPAIIPEDGDRPVSLDDKMDPLDFSRIARHHIAAPVILSQVTVFTRRGELDDRLRTIRQAGVTRVVFVGKPRSVARDGVVGPFPHEALDRYKELIPGRGVITIPTRISEENRLQQKLEAGASFALTQMLFSDQAVPFLQAMARHPQRPEVILSFGYVPKAEQRDGLIRWLIRDDWSLLVPGEQDFVTKLASLPFAEKKRRLVDLYLRVVEGASKLDFPIGVHFESPYGVSEPALETFSAMLEAWSPEKSTAPARGIGTNPAPITRRE